jgi:hypothetical protein
MEMHLIFYGMIIEEVDNNGRYSPSWHTVIDVAGSVPVLGTMALGLPANDKPRQYNKAQHISTWWGNQGRWLCIRPL